MKAITKLYLINLVMLLSALITVYALRHEPAINGLGVLTGTWIAYTMLATPVWLIVTVFTWGKKVD